MGLFNKRILIVEDDNDLRNILSSQLGPTYEIVKAEDGELGLKYAIEFKPDLILLDLLLPKLRGLDMLEQLRKNPDPEVANAKVIVFSNFASGEWIAKATELSVSGYCVKSSTTIEEILSKVKSALSMPGVPKPY
jgi:DNA-binding response OmpR family regulator